MDSARLEPWKNKLIELPSRLSLEVDIIFPSEGEAGPTKLAVCLHPWSWLGGRKEDPTLMCLQRVFLRAGYCVVRYNSRGVGKSSGWPSLTGASEAQDLKDLVQWLTGRSPNVEHVLIAGYSHGSLIASLHPVLPPPIKTHHLILSYPLGPRGWLTAFRTGTYTKALATLVQDPAADVLIVYGTRDEFTGIGKYDAWAQTLMHERRAVALRIERVEGATHFWFNHQQELESIVRSWLQS
ncbi:alpha/beta-hydrolase [Gloeophyllum trabeum ATCC 11539]|uniref:Alpha/beta-hydrolase n=1 Tax=Gloeophyllum trabeum (strain ATCC 11539 / FP-39264 / Madison 617) TaxID=670483 RepID=S7RJF8_GLOTA|nr:alpha/beta-hydrolase [Gloeophyllum trabeum ATCC 11539]EPQ52764.1 alpha/beta-hydrolase [Gloeophyllum trabeum ATCC 11539]